MENRGMKSDSSQGEDGGRAWISGLKAGLPIAVGYIPIAIAFGLLSMSSSVPFHITLLLSMLVFAGASQFIAIQMMNTGAMWGGILLFTFLLNLRHFLMSASLSARLPRLPLWQKTFLSFGITDETFSVASFAANNQLSFPFLIALNGIAYSSWVFGTVIGYGVGTILPRQFQSGMGIALYAMFIAILVPAMNRLRLFLVLSAAGLNTLFANRFPAGISIILSTVLVAAAATFLFPSEVERLPSEGEKELERKGGG